MCVYLFLSMLQLYQFPKQAFCFGCHLNENHYVLAVVIQLEERGKFTFQLYDSTAGRGGAAQPRTIGTMSNVFERCDLWCCA